MGNLYCDVLLGAQITINVNSVRFDDIIRRGNDKESKILLFAIS